MKETYAPLFQPATFPCGVTIEARFTMSPMVVAGTDTFEGVGDEDLAYYERRSATAPMIITGATSVSADGIGFGYGPGAFQPDHLPRLEKLAQTIKAKGAKAVLQIYHAGREAVAAYAIFGEVFSASGGEFDFLDHPVKELSTDHIERIINDFVNAAVMAQQAGFDGVEIHGANHFLPQQFLSTISNFRTDEWGGSLENRSRFALTITERILKATKETDPEFIVGYRVYPEEIHGSHVGYTLDDMVYLVDKVAGLGVDYVHTSLLGPRAFERLAALGEHQGKPVNDVIRDTLAGRCLLIGAGDITSADKALDALNHVDIVAVAAAAVLDPEFVSKIRDGREEDISLDITGRYDDLKMPTHFPILGFTLMSNGSVPQESLTEVYAHMTDEDRAAVGDDPRYNTAYQG